MNYINFNVFFYQVEMVRMMGLLLIVAVKPQHLSHIREIRTTYTKTAFYGLLVSLVFKINCGIYSFIK